MTDITSNKVSIPIDGKEIEFGRLRPNDMFKVVAYANTCVVAAARDVLKDMPLGERVQAIRELSETYRYKDIDSLLTDEKYMIYLVYCAYLRTHPGATLEQFTELFAGVDDIMVTTDMIDKLMWGTPEETMEAAESVDPPQKAD